MSHKRNIKLLLAFDGTGYAGWQKQKSAKTIQGVIEEKLLIMTGEELSLQGAGRTDAGVHALGMVANFHTETNIPCQGFMKGLNSMLPNDIRVLEACEVEADFHARRSAKAKTYWYNFSNGLVQLPTERRYVAHVFEELDIEAYSQLLDYVGDNIHDAQNRVRYTMNGFVIAVATYVKELTEKSMEVAKEIGKVRLEGKEYIVKDGDIVVFRHGS